MVSPLKAAAMTIYNFNKAALAFRLGGKMLNEVDVSKVLDTIAYRILTSAQKKVPVNTGALRASGRVRKVNQFRRIVQFGGAGTGVNYASAVEFGTFRQSPKPFLRPAVIAHQKDIETEMAKAVNRRLGIIARQANSR
jgi:HK97 gp10 family phage protein